MQKCVLTIGNFDGVHVGHRAILRRAKATAQASGAIVKVVTFEPHPAQVLRPETQPKRIQNHDEKCDALRETAADQIVVLQPDKALLSLEPAPFIEQLVAAHHPMVMLEGSNFCFGKARRGDVTLLAEFGRQMGFETIIIDAVNVVLTDQLIAPVSSSLIRWLVSQGRVADAARCLGEPFSLSGRVVKGEQRGQKLGVPTANLDLAELDGRLLAADGVYGGYVDLPDGTRRPAAISVGNKPTFRGPSRCLEAHLLGFCDDLYGQNIKLRFARWLREQRAFGNIHALKDQLARDIDQIRWLEDRELLTVPQHLRATG